MITGDGAVLPCRPAGAMNNENVPVEEFFFYSRNTLLLSERLEVVDYLWNTWIHFVKYGNVALLFNFI